MKQIILQDSVGISGNNSNTDIKTVQAAINELLDLIPPTQKLAVDGTLGKNPEKSKTVAAIKQFQKLVVKMAAPDGRIDANGKSHKLLNQKLAARSKTIVGSQLPKLNGKLDIDEEAYRKAANLIGCEVAAIKAVADVEASGSGFFSSKQPKILFEAHIFSRQTKRIYDKSHPHISSKRWNRALYAGDEKEYPRLKEAMNLDRNAAIKSASWGKFQIMGFNYKNAGSNNLELFLTDMFESESKQLNAFVAFLKSQKLDVPLKNLEWAKFARGYNGEQYQKNKYDEKLNKAYLKYSNSK
ncbi:hypothetical protein MAH1_24230 [Sessilibacter sp. MAH1]